MAKNIFLDASAIHDDAIWIKKFFFFIIMCHLIAILYHFSICSIIAWNEIHKSEFSEFKESHMKKRYKILFGILLTLIILYISTMLLTRDSTFDKEVLEMLEIEHIDKIEIIRASDEKTINITDAAMIDQIMQHFNEQPLRKVRFSNSDFKEAYWLTLRLHDERTIGMRLDDSKHLYVFLYEENYMKDYKLLDDLDLTFIEELF